MRRPKAPGSTKVKMPERSYSMPRATPRAPTMWRRDLAWSGRPAMARTVTQ